jgi:hypothetical protein
LFHVKQDFALAVPSRGLQPARTFERRNASTMTTSLRSDYCETLQGKNAQGDRCEYEFERAPLFFDRLLLWADENVRQEIKVAQVHVAVVVGVEQLGAVAASPLDKGG